MFTEALVRGGPWKQDDEMRAFVTERVLAIEAEARETDERVRVAAQTLISFAWTVVLIDGQAVISRSDADELLRLITNLREALAKS